ncbi:hypothetical protein SERLADRAFT_397348 [Serpula lacrymans var. lacrymans S7.9]|nr:uncharacterized protein SERLADRAFT_397348 [Serpula lacrymans var. lacrymans S7.9]EGO21856.1 hypothetical protein SERLADRAFT_397348 [Serpula lacrymans var. lacrymans S7.9]
MESKAKKALQMEKKDREDQGRVKDVIGGWGAESERSLRKVAQRGVVQLFNTIQQSQAAAAADGPKTSLGSGKQSHLLSSTKKAAAQNRGKHKDVVAGKEATVAKNDFYDLIRSGGLVSKK